VKITQNGKADPNFRFCIQDGSRVFFGSGCTVWYEKISMANAPRRCGTMEEHRLTDAFQTWKFNGCNNLPPPNPSRERTIKLAVRPFWKRLLRSPSHFIKLWVNSGDARLAWNCTKALIRGSFI
jgi:hypothetical protein